MQWVPSSLLSHKTPSGHPRQLKTDAQNSTGEDMIETAQAGSRLMTLPGEIRNLIWRFVLVQDHPSKLEDARFSPVTIANKYRVIVDDSLKAKFKPAMPPPTLSVACRQLREETLPIYYAENLFVVVLDTREAYEAAELWLSSLTDSNIACLQGLVLQGLVVHNRTPTRLGDGSPRAMRIFVDFCSLSVHRENIDGIDQGKQKLVMEYTLADIAKDLEGEKQISCQHIRLLINRFARCCTTPSSEGTVPILATGSHWDKQEARYEQARFIEDFCESRGGVKRERPQGDLEPPGFAIW